MVSDSMELENHIVVQVAVAEAADKIKRYDPLVQYPITITKVFLFYRLLFIEF